MKQLMGSLIVLLGLLGLLTVPVLAADGHSQVEVGFYHGTSTSQNDRVVDQHIPNGRRPYLMVKNQNQPKNQNNKGWLNSSKLPQTNELKTWLLSLVGIMLLMLIVVWLVWKRSFSRLE